MTAAERFREALTAVDGGRLLLTCELESPRNASAANVARQAAAYLPHVDAVTCTDMSAALVRMSPVAATAIAGREGATVLMQLACRHRNRLALQADLLGGAAAGAAGVVCLSGDPPAAGNDPDAMLVADLTPTDLMRAAAGLCAGRLLSGDRVTPAPDLVVGGVENPGAGARSLERLAAKAEAGAAFVQTQMVFDVAAFAAWMARVRATGLHRRVRVIAGVAPVRRLAVARFLDERVAGVRVPAALLTRLEEAAGRSDAEVEAVGVRAAAATLLALRDVPGVAGVHLMTFGWADGVRRVLEEAGLAGGRR